MVSSPPKPLATIQVDLDGLWTNLQYYGHEVSVSPDTILETAIPRFIQLFREFNVKATFFVIGKDAADPSKRKLFEMLRDEGHELANHTFSHPFGLCTLSVRQKKEEVERGEQAIINITGLKPVGFKAPGYDVDDEILSFLAEKGYKYDSSYIPTFVYPLAMRINRWLKGGVARCHGPKWHWFLKKNKPYVVHEPLVEIPCTVFPLLKIPIHATFVMKLGLPYFRWSLGIIRWMKMLLNYEFHAADLADEIRDPRLGHLNGMSLERRMTICRSILQAITTQYTIVASREMARIFQEKSSRLPESWNL